MLRSLSDLLLRAKLPPVLRRQRREWCPCLLFPSPPVYSWWCLQWVQMWGRVACGSGAMVSELSPQLVLFLLPSFWRKTSWPRPRSPVGVPTWVIWGLVWDVQLCNPEKLARQPWPQPFWWGCPPLVGPGTKSYPHSCQDPGVIKGMQKKSGHGEAGLAQAVYVLWVCYVSAWGQISHPGWGCSRPQARGTLTANKEKNKAQMNQISQGFLPTLRFCDTEATKYAGTLRNNAFNCWSAAFPRFLL